MFPPSSHTPFSCTKRDRKHQFVLGLGTNIPGGKKHLDTVATRIAKDPDFLLRGRSAIYMSLPEGGQTFQLFLNSALVVETPLHAFACLSRLHGYEHQHGRLRLKKNGDRSIDIDLLFADRLSLTAPTLQLPHPALWHRSFALVPAVEALQHAHLDVPQEIKLAAERVRRQSHFEKHLWPAPNTTVSSAEQNEKAKSGQPKSNHWLSF